jgi:hypothetical protein
MWSAPSVFKGRKPMLSAPLGFQSALRLLGSLKQDLSYRSLVFGYRSLADFADNGWLGDHQFIPSQTDDLMTRSD